MPRNKRNIDVKLQFQTILESIGGKIEFVKEEEAIDLKVKVLFPLSRRIVSSCPEMEGIYLLESDRLQPHAFHDVDVVIIEAQFGVAENGAIWVTEQELKVRVLPFICEHLVAVLDIKRIIPTMQEAYTLIGSADYGFGAFIAGPSKTADIEQSLVMGAHGPKSMTVLLRY